MSQYLFSDIKKKQYLLLIVDLAVIFLSIFISYSIRIYLTRKSPSLAAVLSKISPWQLLLMLAHLFTLHLFGQYNLARMTNLLRSIGNTVASVWFVGLIVSGVFFFFPKYIFGRQVLMTHILLLSVFLIIWRYVFINILIKSSVLKRIAIVGNEKLVSAFIEEISNMRNCGYTTSCACILDSFDSDVCRKNSNVIIYQDLDRLIEENSFDVIVFDSKGDFFSENEIRKILEIKFVGKGVYDLPTFYKNLTGKIPLSFINGQYLLSSDNLKGEYSGLYIRIKRIWDFFVSLLLLMVLSPLLFCIAIAIKMESKGKVFFVQERLGAHKVPFHCLKFRTMVENAEKESGPVWTVENDPRITRVGRFLRKSRLDELPQLYNILRGNMSFIGPRPIRKHFAEKLACEIPFYDLRFSIKPGLSGWAQVNYDYAGSEAGQMEKFQYELFYIENMSFFIDLLTVFKTFQKIFNAEGT